MNMKALLTGIAGVLASISLHAQELDTLTVTNHLSPEAISATGRNILIIPGEKLYNLPVHSIDELLRYVPGLELQMRGPLGSQSDLVIRGGTFQQCLVLIDGLRLNDANTGHFSTYIPISPDEIDHIEVLKGSASAIYGPEAVGGVVHVITKTFSRKQGQTQLNAQASLGSHELVQTQAGGFAAIRDWAIGGGFWTGNTNGSSLRGTTGFANNVTGSLSARKDLGRGWDLALRTALDRRDFNAQNFYTSFLSDTASEKIRSFWNQASLAWKGVKSSFGLQGGYKSLTDEYRFNSVSLANNNLSKLWQGLATYQHVLGKTSSLTTGAQFFRRIISSNDRGNHNVDAYALFAALSYHLANLTLQPALRADKIGGNNVQVSPQLNLALQAGRFTIRGSGGRSIRTADFTELYNNYGKALVTGGRLGNPDLSAEEGWNYEGGVDYKVTNGFKLSAGYFARRQKNLIDYLPRAYADIPRKTNLVPTGSYALAVNVAEVNTDGVEFDLSLNQNLGKGSLSGGLGLIWLNTRSSNGNLSLYLSGSARFLGNTNLRYELGNFGIGLTGVHKVRDAQMAAGMVPVSKQLTMINGRVDYGVLSKLKIFGQVDNIGNEQGSDLLGAMLPGRWFSGGVSLSLKKN